MEYQWSPDSRWLLYRWTDLSQSSTGDYIPGKQYVAIATPDGKTQRRVELPITGYMQLDSVSSALPFVTGWSADSAYVALRINGRRAFLHIPDLSLSFPTWSNFQSVPHLCLALLDGENSYCSFWSPTGHLIAFGALDTKNQAFLVLANPDEPKPMGVFSVEAQKYMQVIWSPGSQYVALTSLPINLDSWAGQIGIFGMNGRRFNVTAKSIPYPAGDAPDFINAVWCNDRDLLYIAGISPTLQTAQIDDFSVSNRRSLILEQPVDPYNFPALPTILVNCDYALQEWTQNGINYAGVMNTQTSVKMALVDHDVTGIEAIGNKIALAWWQGGVAWMNADGTNRHTITLDADITPQTASIDDQWLLVRAAQNNTTDLYLVNLASGTYRVVVQNADNAIQGFAAFAPNNAALVLAVETNHAIKVLALPDGQPHTMESGMPDKIDSVDWAPDGSVFTVLSESNTTTAFDLFTPDGTLVRHYEQVPNFRPLTWLTCQR